MQMHYRDEEAIYVRASADRVTVIFSTVFREETDRIFGRVFLQVCTHSTCLSSSRCRIERSKLKLISCHL